MSAVPVSTTWLWGERRATSIKKFLAANGVAEARLKTISYGKERPAVLGSNEQAWASETVAVSVLSASNQTFV